MFKDYNDVVAPNGAHKINWPRNMKHLRLTERAFDKFGEDGKQLKELRKKNLAMSFAAYKSLSNENTVWYTQQLLKKILS
jgi:hypothetical protein